MGTVKLNQLLLKSSIEFPCSYIKGKLEKRIYVSIVYPESGEIVSELTRKGFRRNYNHMYIPSCKNCNSCISSRINIKKFVFTKSNKRNLRLNKDLTLIVNNNYNKNRYDLFKQYCRVRHSKGSMKTMTENEFIGFFHKSINKTIIYDLVDSENKLYGSILLDVLKDGYSAVYSFFDPNFSNRGLGKNLILRIIKNMKEKESPFLYLGYWVKESKNMRYKSSYNNIEYYRNENWDSINS